MRHFGYKERDMKLKGLEGKVQMVGYKNLEKFFV